MGEDEEEKEKPEGMTERRTELESMVRRRRLEKMTGKRKMTLKEGE